MPSSPTGANHRGPMPTTLSFLTVYLSESYRNKLPELFSQIERKERIRDQSSPGKLSLFYLFWVTTHFRSFMANRKQALHLAENALNYCTKHRGIQ